MSESTFPFGAAADSPALAVDEESSGSRKPLLAVGGLVGALALGAGAFLLLGGSGSDDDLALGVPPSVPPAAAPAAEPQAVAVIPAASTESIGRNPFKARYIAPVAAPAPAEAPVAAPAALPAPQPVQITVAQAPAPAPAAEPAPAQYPITLVAVSEPKPEARTVTWKIDDKELTVLPGQRFGKYGELVVLAYTTNEDGSTITGVILQVGDATPFDALLGQTYDVL